MSTAAGRSSSPRAWPVSLGLLAAAVAGGWLGPDVDRGAGFCEAAAGHGAPAGEHAEQPRLRRGRPGHRGARRATGRAGRGTMAGRPGLATAYACLVVLLGPGSMAMHATETALGGHLDMLEHVPRRRASPSRTPRCAASTAVRCSWRSPSSLVVAVCELVGTYDGRVPVVDVLRQRGLRRLPARRAGARAAARAARRGHPRPALAGGRGRRAGRRLRGLEHRQGRLARSAGRTRSTRATACGTCCARSRRTACSGSTSASSRSVHRPVATFPVRLPQLALEDLAGRVARQRLDDVDRLAGT